MKSNHMPCAPAAQLDARALARALRGAVVAADAILAPGPGHSSRDRSLSIKLDPRAQDGFVVFSHSGDDWRACRDHVKVAAGIETGIASNPSPRPALALSTRPVPDDAERIRRAASLWHNAEPLSGSLAAMYLRNRRLDIHPGAFAHCLRYHPACPIRKERLPSLIALMCDPVTGEPTGIQRTALTSEALKHPQGRAMLGRAGVVMLCPDHEVSDGLGIAEGIETALAIMTLGWRPTWAGLSAGMIGRLPVLTGVEALTIFADYDDAGLAAAEACAARWSDAGRETRIVRPERIGADFADVVTGGAP